MPELDFSNIQKQGYLQKESRFLKQWRNRYMVLTPTHLVSFENDQMKKATEILALQDCTTIKSADDEIQKQFSFRLDCDKQSFYMISQNNKDKEQWIGAIGKLMVKQNLKKKDDSESDD